MSEDSAILDVKKGNWVDKYSPKAIRPFLKLGRVDRPIGIWLLFWPATWAIAMAGNYTSYPDLNILGLFLLGAIVMRSAGCAFNDIVDRDYDSKVARTRNRPIAGREISVQNAWLFLMVLALVGLLILLQFNYLTVALGIGSLVFVGIYPFMKRVTYWPQAFLGLTFNWGALLGWAAVTGILSLEALFLYLAGIFWTLGYDTIYAHMDKTDDILVGVKSTALKFGENTRAWLFVFYGLSLGFFFLAGYQNGLSQIYYIGLVFVFFHFHTQISTLDIHSPEACLKTFKSNNLIGLVMFLVIWASKVT